MSFRISDIDMRAKDIDGLGENWPLRYAELAKYYDKAEKFIGVTGDVEGIPSAPDGVFERPPAPKVHERLAREAGKKLGVKFIANRRAIITSNKNGRAACHYCGQCGRGCLTASGVFRKPGRSLPRARDRQPRAHHRSHGARGHRRPQRQAGRRHLHRPQEPPRAEDPRQGGHPRGQLLRVGPHPAQLQVEASSQRAR